MLTYISRKRRKHSDLYSNEWIGYLLAASISLIHFIPQNELFNILVEAGTKVKAAENGAGGYRV